MRITFLLPGYYWGPSGGVRMVYEYANRLVVRGHQVAVVHPRRIFSLPSSDGKRLTIYQWLRRSLIRTRNALFKPSVDWQPINKNVELFFVADSGARHIPDGDAIFATGWNTVQSVLEYPRSKGEKCYLIQGYESYQGQKELVDATWRSSLHKVVIAKWMLELGKELGCAELTYVPNAIDHNRYRLTQPMEGRPRQVAMLFSSTPIKGASDGIEALRMVRSKYPDLKVVFFGVGRHQSWIPDWVRYYRNPPQDFLIEEIYNKSSIYLAPSWTEGYGLPPAEAACCGCAVVATDTGGFREYIQHGITGLLSAPKDPKALAENLLRVLDNENLRLELAGACGNSLRHLSWDRSTDLLERFITNVVRNNSYGKEFSPEETAAKISERELQR